MNYESIHQYFKSQALFDVRVELIRDDDQVHFRRIAIKSCKEEFESEVHDYNKVIFLKVPMIGEAIVRLLDNLNEKKTFDMYVGQFVQRIVYTDNLDSLDFTTRNLATGQWDSIQSFRFPARIVETNREVESYQLSAHFLNKEGMLYFPSLREAELYYLYDLFESNSSYLPFFRLALLDERAWISKIIVEQDSLQLYLEGSNIEECEVKLYGRDPGLAKLVSIKNTMPLRIKIEQMPKELGVYLFLGKEKVDYRTIDERRIPFAPQEGVFFEDDKNNNIENVINLQGEGLYLEYKENLGDKINDTICAFANTKGGSIYLGVDNDGNVVGVEDWDKQRLSIENSWQDNSKGLVNIRYKHHAYKNPFGKELSILEIKVEEARSKPIAIRQKDKEIYYIRRDGSTRRMQREDFVSLINEEIENRKIEKLN